MPILVSESAPVRLSIDECLDYVRTAYRITDNTYFHQTGMGPFISYNYATIFFVVIHEKLILKFMPGFLHQRAGHIGIC